jgi:hypothetical protein
LASYIHEKPITDQQVENIITNTLNRIQKKRTLMSYLMSTYLGTNITPGNGLLPPQYSYFSVGFGGIPTKM